MKILQIVTDIDLNIEELKVGNKFPCPFPLSENIHLFTVPTSKGIAGFLTLYFENPTDDEIVDAKEGEILSGIFSSCDLIILLLKIGKMPWLDIHSCKSKMVAKGTLSILLVDSNTNKILVNREIIISKEFSERYMKEMLKPVPECYQHCQATCSDRIFEHHKFLPEYYAEKVEIFPL